MFRELKRHNQDIKEANLTSSTFFKRMVDISSIYRDEIMKGLEKKVKELEFRISIIDDDDQLEEYQNEIDRLKLEIEELEKKNKK